TDHVVFVISKAEKNSISDDIPVVVYNHDLLRLFAAEIGEAIKSSSGHYALDSRTLKIEIIKLKGLVKQDGGMLPSPLLVKTAAVLGRVLEIVTCRWRHTHHLHRACRLLQFVFERDH